jgi:signal transduction histidine kinase/ligand-binding sensor domain-containing protein
MNVTCCKRSLWILLLLLRCIQSHGINRDQKLANLYHTAWTFKDGAPAEIYALAQTTDGFLWLGTATGLFRFDGIRFEPYRPESGKAFRQRSVVSLFAVPDGGLWVGYSFGGVSFIKNGSVTDYGESEGLPSDAVLAFARDRQGTIWIAAGEDGLARLEGSHWRRIGTDSEFAGKAYTVFVDHAGTVWVGTPTSVAYLVEGGHQFQIAARDLRPIVRSVAEGPAAKLWMAEGGYGVRPIPSPGRKDGRLGPAVLVGAPAIIFDNEGSLWITTAGNGIRRVPYPERLHPPKIRGPSAWKFHNSEVEAFSQENGLTGDFVHCVLQDREGNVWFGTTGGLDRFRQSPVVSVPLQPISYHGALPIPSLHSFSTSALAVGDEGALWAAGIGPQVLLRIQNDRIVTQLRDRPVDCAYRDPNGVVWLATPSSIIRVAHQSLDTGRSKPGAVTYGYHGAVRAGNGLVLRELDLPTVGGIAVSPQSRIRSITQDRLGKLWISMWSGTFRLERSGWTTLESLGGPKGSATTEFTDPDGRIWFGFANTVAMLDGDSVRTFSDKDGVQIGAVTSIQSKGKNIWIGGELGLEFFDGSRFQPVKTSDGGTFGGISGIVADPEHGLWFSEKRGIIHIPEAQLRHLGSGKVEFESFGLLDGLSAELRGPLASPSAVQSTDGRIWFATTKGVAWIDPKPERIVRNTVPPSVTIESVVADGMKYNNSRPFRLPPRTGNLEIAYTATSLTIPERVQFRYRLEGQDEGWQEPGTRREAVYTNLGTGSYRFHVIACNNDGVWNEAGASLDFYVAPTYYQTNWFRSLCVGGFLGLLWMAYQMRLRRLRTQFAMTLDARVGERTRIARELHDTLLQSLHGLMFQFQAARNMLPARPQDAIRTLDGAINKTEQAIAESRSTIQGLRHESAAQTDLAQFLTAIAQDLTPKEVSAHSPGFQVIVEGERQTLSPLVQEEVEQIARELLRNAFQHAQAREIEAEIHYDHHLLRVRIRDDGKGMERKVMDRGGRVGHWGLTGVRERAQRIGAQLDFWSEAGAGTEVQLTVPATIAYKTRGDSAGFRVRKAKP